MFPIRAALLGALLFTPLPAGAQDGVTVTFLANEGVMLSSGGRKVLIDALFRKYETGYAVPADSTRHALERAEPPFDAVDVVLVTHRHGDHFHPASVASHLRVNPRAVLLAPEQVIDSLHGRLGPGSVAPSRLRARGAGPGARHVETIAEVTVHALGLRHVGWRWRHRRVEHVAYLVEIGGRRVLHVGDADLSEAALAPLRLDTARVDVALLPAWSLTDPGQRRAIERWIRPRQVVAFHLGTDTARASRAVRAAAPQAIVLVRSLEARRW